MSDFDKLKNANLVSYQTFEQRNLDIDAVIDSKDYMGMYPKIGLEAGYTEAIINSDFKYSIGKDASMSFSIVDRDAKQILYYTTTTPTGMRSTFKAYRYSYNESFIFVPEPISLTFLAANERVDCFYNVGTNFILIGIASTDMPKRTTRIVLVKTDGSSMWADWTLAYDVTSLMNAPGTYTNIFLVQKNGQDYLLRLSGMQSTKLDVFNSSQQLLRSLTVFNEATDMDFTDRAGRGRTGVTDHQFYYYGNDCFPGFTWNPITESLHFRIPGWQVVRYPNGSSAGHGYTMSVAWKLPFSWISTGTGTASNLIPVKSNGFRYRTYIDNTWNTETGGMSDADSGANTTTTTDEYSGDVHYTRRGTWGAEDGGHIRIIEYLANTPVLTYATNIDVRIKNKYSVTIPDGSPYAKGFNANNAFIIGNYLFTHGISGGRSDKSVRVNFSTSVFQSIVTAKDTLYLDPTSIVNDPFKGTLATSTGLFESHFNTFVVGGVGRKILCTPGSKLLEMSLVNNVPTWTALNTVFPVIPSQVQGTTVLGSDVYVWNGDAVNPVFYACIKTSTYLQMIKYSAGSWKLHGGFVGVATIDAGNTSRGDSAYLAEFNQCNTLLTETGKLLFSFRMPVPGDNIPYAVVVDTVAATSYTTGTIQLFDGKPSLASAMYNYAPVHTHGTTSYGYSEVFGYYALRAPLDRTSFRIISSKDPRGAGPEITETQWLNNTATRHEIVVTASSSVGLLAYLSEYPIFIGGYFTKIPQTTISLLPNTDNYIFAIKGTSGRNDVQISVSSRKFSNTFSRVCIAKVTTSVDKVLSAVTYSVDGIGFPDQEGKVGNALLTNGKNTYWYPLLAKIAELESRLRALGG